MATFELGTSGRWSGGGSAVIRNLALAANLDPSILSIGGTAKTRLVPRNAVYPSLLLRRFLWLPQNAWPWIGPPGKGPEARMFFALRLASELAARRAVAIIRLSTIIPTYGKALGPPLPNVLDDQFETALAKAATASPDPYRTISVGSITGFRNLRRLVTSIVRIRDSGIPMTLLVAGPVNSPTEARWLEVAADHHPWLTFEATNLARHQVITRIRSSSVVVFPSLVEASPITPLEALALNARIAVSDVPGHRETLEPFNAECQWFDPLSVTDMSDAISKAFKLPAPHPSPLHTPESRSQARHGWCYALLDQLSKVALA